MTFGQTDKAGAKNPTTLVLITLDVTYLENTLKGSPWELYGAAR